MSVLKRHTRARRPGMVGYTLRNFICTGLGGKCHKGKFEIPPFSP